jgi:transposase InsO family protein
VIVDDYTRYTWIFFLVDKNDVFATFKSFVNGIHNEFETTIKRVRSDNGSEFKNTRTDELCDEFGIRHQFLVKYTPQSNNLCWYLLTQIEYEGFHKCTKYDYSILPGVF